MSRRLKLYAVYYSLHFDKSTNMRYCLAYSECQSYQVLIRSLVNDGIELNTFDIIDSLHLVSYR